MTRCGRCRCWSSRRRCQAGRPERTGRWSVAGIPVSEWTDGDRGPGQTRGSGQGPRTAQSRSAKCGGGSSRHVQPEFPGWISRARRREGQGGRGKSWRAPRRAHRPRCSRWRVSSLGSSAPPAGSPRWPRIRRCAPSASRRRLRTSRTPWRCWAAGWARPAVPAPTSPAESGSRSPGQARLICRDDGLLRRMPAHHQIRIAAGGRPCDQPGADRPVRRAMRRSSSRSGCRS